MNPHRTAHQRIQAARREVLYHLDALRSHVATDDLGDLFPDSNRDGADACAKALAEEVKSEHARLDKVFEKFDRAVLSVPREKP